MFCKNCGKEIHKDLTFCDGCGTAITSQQPYSQQYPINTDQQQYTQQYPMNTNQQSYSQQVPLSSNQPQYSQQNPMNMNQQQYAQQNYPNMQNPYPIPKKKKRPGCFIAVLILLAILGAGTYFVLSLFGMIGSKNLGVQYTEADYQSAMGKIGTDIIFEGKSGTDLRDLSKELKKTGEKLPIADYEWKHSDYQEKSFTLTSEEASAFLNEVAPAIWWFEDQQIHVLPDGEIEASGTALLKKAMNDLYPELVQMIPFPMFDKVNLYAKGRISIKENQLDLQADTFKTGPIEGISAKMLNENAYYFEKLYTSVPGLIIHSLEVNRSGEIEVDALIPQLTEIIKK